MLETAMEWGTDWNLRFRIVLSMLLLGVLPFAFVYTMLFAVDRVGFEIIGQLTRRPLNGHLYVEPWLLGIAVAVGFGIQFYWGERVALRSIGASKVSKASRPELQSRLDRLAQQADMPVPELALSRDETPNAFTVGRQPFGSTVVVTQGLLDALDDDELDAVLAHELAHIKNRDVTVMTLAYFLPTLTYMLAMFALTILRFLFHSLGSFRHVDDDGAKGVFVAILIVVLSAVITLTVSVLFWIGSFSLFRLLSRYREYAADRGAAAITGKPLALASALQEIDDTMSDLPDSDLREQDGGLEALYVAPIDTYQFGDKHDLLTSNIFPSTHPPTGERVERLQEISTEVET